MLGGICDETTDYNIVWSDSTKLKAVNGSVKPLSMPNKAVWNGISQVDASRVSRLQYTTDIHSDLVNSYAFDTALFFICCCSDTDYYKLQFSNNFGQTIFLTGENNDEKCKINDIGHNLGEWTTETCTGGYDDEPATLRADSDTPLQKRIYQNHETCTKNWGFRTILYF